MSIPPEIVKNFGWVPGDPLEVYAEEALKAAIVRKKGVQRTSEKRAVEVAVQ